MLLRRLQEYFKFLKSLFRTVWRLLWGMWKLTRLPQPAITVFGGARIANDSPHAQLAIQLTKKLVAHGFSIITGGGPGIMEAANQGAVEYLKSCDIHDPSCEPHKLVSAGIGLLHLNKEKVNPYVQDNIVMAHFFARKWLLVRYSVGFVVFPGGFGTVDELFEVLTLVQCNRMAKVPVILIDSIFWAPIFDWIDTRALASNLIGPEDKSLISVADTADEAFEIIRKYCSGANQSVTYSAEEKK
jgi:uncharacterized protein (TIGR00730 family)